MSLQWLGWGQKEKGDATGDDRSRTARDATTAFPMGKRRVLGTDQLAVKLQSVNEPPLGAPTPFSKKQPPPKERPIELTFFTASW